MSFEEVVSTTNREELLSLVSKYNRPGPRYTSYPTVAEWTENFGVKQHIEAIAESDRDASLYFHIPFCQSLCLYCACTRIISKDQTVSDIYLKFLSKEIENIANLKPNKRAVSQIHLGGGTPTFLSPDQLSQLFSTILKHFDLQQNAEISIEIDPRTSSEQHFQTLRSLGFNRVSLGLQDFNPVVQKIVNRVQSFELVDKSIKICRELGFTSINIDLIYGLPHQTIETFSETVEKVLDLKPDRIALFSYAHVPWMRNHQKSFEHLLPTPETKFQIFLNAIGRFTEAGYRYIGMDHFALTDDELCKAQDERSLHRNFQGYTTKAGCDLYGFGMSSISSFKNSYAQNYATLEDYYKAIETHQLATMRGKLVSAEDDLRRSVIGRILCHLSLIKSEVEENFGIDFDNYFSQEVKNLKELEEDGLVRLSKENIEVTPLGRLFIRNIAMVFDNYLRQAEQKRFSKTI